MNNIESVTQSELAELLLETAIVRPVFIWGQPGIGKSAIVEQFAKRVGLECVTLHGSHMLPEDIMGVPEIRNRKSYFCPPELIARDEPYVLFLDELNGATMEVQTAFYPLILEQRISSYHLPLGSIIVAAGNRQEDVAGIKPIRSALINRMLHIELKVSYKDWLGWAYSNGIHSLVTNYIEQKPDHLLSRPSKLEEPFSSPRAWHMLSDLLSQTQNLTDIKIKRLSQGCLKLNHAKEFASFFKLKDPIFKIKKLLSGDEHWPNQPEDRDLLLYLAKAFRSDIIKTTDGLTRNQVAPDYLHNVKRLLKQLLDVNAEIATLILTDIEDERNYPDWFITEIARDIPRLVAS